MAYHGPPPTGRPGMLPPPHGLFPAPSYGPPPVMMIHQVGQAAPSGMLPTGVPIPVPPPGMPPPMMLLPRGPGISAEPQVKVPVPSSTATMKIATTVFVGNISEKASDTLIRQILLRCGAIDGWKRVQDATGKLQGFGFCEYADPDSTLRALRLLHNLKLGEKALVAKVDAKTRKDLLKYLIMKKHSKMGGFVNEDKVDTEVAKLEEDKDVATAALISEVPDEEKIEDNHIKTTINNLLKDYLSILSSSKSNEDIQRERDVKESILFMAKQSGKIDPNSTLEDMDMDNEVKTLVSDEIKRFRESYKRSDEARKEKKARDKDKDKRDKDDDDKAKKPNGGTESPRVKKRERSRSPVRRPISSPSRRQRSPLRSRSQERQEKEKRREALRQKELEEMAKEDEEQEERQRQRRVREREKAFKQRLNNWESREYRKEKEYDKESKREKERREEMEREKKHLGDFLAEYDDHKDDQKYYKGSAYNRRRHEREVEIENDDRDRYKEKDELEELRLQVIERQAREILSEAGRASTGEESPAREGEEEEEDMDVPVKEEEEEDIPLTKSGYTVPPAYPPIQVQSAPTVSNPPDTTTASTGSYRPIVSSEHSASPSVPLAKTNDVIKQQEASEGNSPASYSSPTAQSKLTFGLAKKAPAGSASGQSSGPGPSKLDKVFTADNDDMESQPKKKLVPIDYSDEEEPSARDRDSGDGRRKSRERERDRDRLSSSSKRRSSSQQNQYAEVGLVMRGSSLELMEEMKDRKLTAEERKKITQTLVNNIPTLKEEVFEYKLKWDQIDEGLIEKRIGPWINKKITEYIGEAEPVLKEFICNKLSCHISPEDILNDISMVLDDEAEVFIVKLWRLLIYETEAKHLGIAKSY